MVRGAWKQATWAELLCFPLRMAFVLHQAGPHHSHGSRGAEYAPLEEGPREPLPLGNTSVRAAFVHVLGDLLQSLGVLAASILIYFKVPSVQACPSLPPPIPPPSPSFPGSPPTPLHLPAPQDSWPRVIVPFTPAGFSGASQVLFVQDAPRSSSERSLIPRLRAFLLYSLSTRQLTPSAPFSSPSVPLDPPLPPSEMFSASSWKVSQTPLLPTPRGPL